MGYRGRELVLDGDWNPRPWEQQVYESEEAWLAFQVYRDLAPPRSMADVDVEFVRRGKRSRTATLYRGWSSQWKWRTRAAFYDVHLDRLRQEAAEKVVKDMGRRHAQMAQAGLTMIARRLMGSAEHSIRPIDMNEVDFPALITAMQGLVKLERIARGEPGERATTELTGPGGGPVQVMPVEPPVEDPVEDARRMTSVLAILAESGVVILPAGSGEPGAPELPATIESGSDGPSGASEDDPV